ADAVLRAGRLVDRQQERRDAETLDEEVRNADLRRAERGDRERRVRRRGHAVRRLRRVRVLERLLDAAGERLDVRRAAVGEAGVLALLGGLPGSAAGGLGGRFAVAGRVVGLAAALRRAGARALR